jgi:hypothetical protein
MSVDTIRTKIVQKLSEMNSIEAAFNWETSNPSGHYPYATVTLAGGTGEFRSSATNLRQRNFSVKIYQERSKIGQGPEAAEDIVTNVIDELEKSFDMDTTLSGTCKYVMPVKWDAKYQDRETDTRLLDIDIEAVELVNSQ